MVHYRTGSLVNQPRDNDLAIFPQKEWFGAEPPISTRPPRAIPDELRAKFRRSREVVQARAPHLHLTPPSAVRQRSRLERSREGVMKVVRRAKPGEASDR
jgi:hypothetical protein